MSDLFAAPSKNLPAADLTKAEMQRAFEARIDSMPRLHVCALCGAAAQFGFGVSLRKGQIGVWSCFQHRAEVKSGKFTPHTALQVTSNSGVARRA